MTKKQIYRTIPLVFRCNKCGREKEWRLKSSAPERWVCLCGGTMIEVREETK